jgi:hypothetical protein
MSCLHRDVSITNCELVLVPQKTHQLEFFHCLICIVYDGDFRTKCVVDGFEDLELTLSQGVIILERGVVYNAVLNLMPMSEDRKLCPVVRF